MLIMFDTMRNMNIKEYNIIAFYGLKKFFKDWFKDGNKSARQSYQSISSVLACSLEDSFNYMLESAMSELNLEVLALIKECYGNGKLKSNRSLIQTLTDAKSKLPQEFASINGDRLLKLLRDAVVHNGKENNHIFDDFKSVRIALQKNKTGETSEIGITKQDLLNYMFSFDSARNLQHQFGGMDINAEAAKGIKEILQMKKTKGKFANFLTVYNEKNQQIDIDNFQENAYLRFLLKYKKFDSKFENFQYFLTRFFPYKDNKIYNYETKCRLLEGLMLIYEDISVKRGDVVKLFKEAGDECGMFCFLDEETLMSIIYSSMCYSIVSSNTNEELLELCKKAGIDIEQENVAHLRNSFIHGRYFYNYKNAFEIYDGISDLVHYLTFDFSQVEKLYSAYTENQTRRIRQERFKYIMRNIQGVECQE